MDLNQSNLAIRKLLAKYSNTDPDDWFLTFKTRFGMAVAMQSIYDIYGHGEVITQPYTCITAVNPILVANLKPVYTDTDPSTLSLSNPEKLYNSKTVAIVMQHTLGLIDDKAEKIAAFAQKHRLILFEDSAHCATRMATDSKGHILADISIHSFGVEKVLQNTKFGGAIYVNPSLKKKNSQLYDRITSNLLNLPQPPLGLKLRSRTYRFQNGVLHRLPNSLFHDIRNLAYKAHIFELAVAPYEQSGEQARPYATTKFVNNTILKHLPTLPAIYKRRLKNTQIYNKRLASCPDFEQITTVEEPLLAYPIIFNTAKAASDVYDILTSSGYFIRRWYSPLLYPGPTSNRRYHYNAKMSPTAEQIHPRILCLPTDLEPEKMKKILSILQPVDKPVEKVIKSTKN
ncbi:MAG: DegT/DnrJ/EryC1/StrS family aminotransferase [Candidatus Saccharibacteria bacterium]|nr:DegT/DnrJ/EryC1/StrS family aminotransferase [Candidatus Saccharibacteria bacterium]